MIETMVFLGLAALTLGSAFVAVFAPRIVHAAFGLLGAFFGVAGLYALLGADFVALAQILVYVGGILVLLVFGVLLTQRAMGPLGLADRPRLVLPVVAGGVLLAALLLTVHATDWDAAWPDVAVSAEPEPTTAEIGRAFLDPGTDPSTSPAYLVPFELASVLLLAALVGAAYLVRRRRRS